MLSSASLARLWRAVPRGGRPTKGLAKLLPIGVPGLPPSALRDRLGRRLGRLVLLEEAVRRRPRRLDRLRRRRDRTLGGKLVPPHDPAGDEEHQQAGQTHGGQMQRWRQPFSQRRDRRASDDAIARGIVVAGWRPGRARPRHRRPGPRRARRRWHQCGLRRGRRSWRPPQHALSRRRGSASVALASRVQAPVSSAAVRLTPSWSPITVVCLSPSVSRALASWPVRSR